MTLKSLGKYFQHVFLEIAFQRVFISPSFFLHFNIGLEAADIPVKMILHSKTSAKRC